MPRGGGVVNFEADLTMSGQLFGALDGLSKQASTPNYTSAMVEETHAILSTRFDSHMRAVYAGNPKGFKHVFEWGARGAIKGKLWKHRLTGRGANRNADFQFITSKAPIPAPTPRSTGVSAAELSKLSGKRYVFRWKASVIEFGIPVTIRPRGGKKLFIPFGRNNPSVSDDRARERGFVFAESAQVDNPGGRDAAGNFTGVWMAWWSQEAPRIFAQEISKKLEERLEDIVLEGGRIRRTSGNIGNRGFKMGFAAGRAGAQALALAQSKSALTQARLLNAWDETL